MRDMGAAHLEDGTLAGLAERRLSPGQIAGALKHLETCDACRARAAAYARDPEEIHEFEGVAMEHLEEEDLFAYVDGVARPDQVEIVETHVEDCAACRAQLDELRELRIPTPSRSIRWIAIAASLLIAAALVAIFFMIREEPRTTAPIATTPAKQPAPARAIDTNPEWTQLAAEAVRSGELPFPAFLSRLGGESDALRGDSAMPVDRVAPAGIVIDTTRPEFSWPARGDSFVVVVYDGTTEVARSGELRVARWQPPRDLPRGRTYAWQVEVTKDGETDYIPAPPAPPALIRIATDEEHRAIEQALRERPGDSILHAVLYARAGLRDEALASLRATNDANARKILVRYEKP